MIIYNRNIFRLIVGLLLLVVAIVFTAIAENYDFENTALSPERRIENLLSRMTPLEKISQLGNSSLAIPRFGITSYEYWNEAIHGVVANGVTVFPQAIGLSCTWDTVLEYKIATAISDEARALNTLTGKGLTYWAPTVNMARDPRWGRNEETYGEDVFLTKKFVVNFIRGMQGNDKKYLKTVATVKHFACNNIEKNRTGISSDVDEKSLREYYLPVFKAAVEDGNVQSVMGAYNAINGVPSCANTMLLTDILRTEWGFSGYVVSDCGAIDYISKGHHFVSSYQQAAALAIKSGCDLCCGLSFQQYLPLALTNTQLFLGKTDLDRALTRIFIARCRLGCFDPSSMVPYSSIPSSVINSQKHHDLALDAARKSLVLLKNANNILPLNDSTLQNIAVIGPHANTCQLGGYSGVPVQKVSPLAGIQNRIARFPNIKLHYAAGCSISGKKDQALFDNAVALAKQSDVAIMFMGTNNTYASEGVDLDSLGLPGAQLALIQAVHKVKPRTIVVLINGNPLSTVWVQDSIPGIIEAWYGGQSQGTAIAEALFGDYNPGGKLTSTWVSSVNDLPAMDNYAIFNNRTYMYFIGKPLYPFGFGLSYTRFAIDNIQIRHAIIGNNETTFVSVDVQNTGTRFGDEVVQLYISNRNKSGQTPVKQLKGFDRVSLMPREKKTITFPLPYSEFSTWNLSIHAFKVEQGVYDLFVGNSSINSSLTGKITVVGDLAQLNKRFVNQVPFMSRLSKNRFQIVFTDNNTHRVDVYTVGGRLVYTYKNAGVGVCEWRANTAGVYYVKMTGKDFVKNERLIVVR